MIHPPARAYNRRAWMLGPAPAREISYDRTLHAADGLADRFTITHLNVAANNRANRNPFYVPSVPGRGFVFAVQFVRVDCSFLFHVDDRNVAVGAETNGAFPRINLPDLGRVFASQFDVVIQS